MYPECLILSGIPSVYVTEDDTCQRCVEEDPTKTRRLLEIAQSVYKFYTILFYIMYTILTIFITEPYLYEFVVIFLLWA